MLHRRVAYAAALAAALKPDLTIVDSEDYVTLVTCVPIAVNSHRLLVRGIRTE